MKYRNKGMLLVVSGPSGAGKGTLTRRLMAEDGSFESSVSVTTRAARPGEVDGVHYHFITEERYDQLLAEEAFVEHANVHGHRYGTLKSEVFSRMHRGINVLLEIDPQGASEVMRQVPECVTVFILPPSYEALRSRLMLRNTENLAEIERRLRNAPGEIGRMGIYQYAVVNDQEELAWQQLRTIVEAEKLRTLRFFPELEDSADSAVEEVWRIARQRADASC